MRWDFDRHRRSLHAGTDPSASLVDLLDPRPGEIVVDLGCGTGELSAEIARRKATVIGVDSSPDMVARARNRFPDLEFAVADATGFTPAEPVDAVFSNGALHWIADQQAALDAVARILRPGGRLVLDMGGAGNTAALLAAVDAARARRGFGPAARPWCFPTPAELTARLERAGLWPRLVHWFEQPARIGTDGHALAEWVAGFGQALLDDVPRPERAPLLADAADLAAPALRRADGWYADYRRLRVLAELPAEK